MGLPVCVGIAPTKTFAKLASRCAKKLHLFGVCDFGSMSEARSQWLLERIEVGDVCGVGRRLSEGLGAKGIRTAQALKDALDAVNGRFGEDTLRLASAGTEKLWAMKCEARTPRWTTRWDELPTAKAD